MHRTHALVIIVIRILKFDITIGYVIKHLPVQLVSFAEQWVEWLADTVPVRRCCRHRERRNQLTQ